MNKENKIIFTLVEQDNFDIFNYYAVQLLEMAGIVDPAQNEIDKIEARLKKIYAKKNH